MIKLILDTNLNRNIIFGIVIRCLNRKKTEFETVSYEYYNTSNNNIHK